jgi:hypothetical protein
MPPATSPIGVKLSEWKKTAVGKESYAIGGHRGTGVGTLLPICFRSLGEAVLEVL